MRTKKQLQSKIASIQSKTKTRTCKVCFGEIEETTIHSFIHKDVYVCYKCFLEFKPVLKQFDAFGYKGYFVYHYSDKIKEVLYQFKGCFDYELANTFFDYFRIFLHFKYRGYIIVPAPSNAEADKTRGFNHVVEMFRCLKLPIEQCIKKTKNIKQADLSAHERQNIKNYLEIEDVNLSNKKVLIVDDVYTTGSTIKAMIDLLKTKNPKRIKVLVMSKTKDIHEN